jgi:arylsulfatase A-like enzyme
MGLDRTFTERDAKLVVPGNLTAEQKTAWSAYYEPRNAKYAAAAPTGRDLVKWRYQRYMHDYLACVKAVDENVGRVLDYLDKNDLTKNTVVILSSDQGFYLGEHGWFDKRWLFEESLRSPLLMRWPGVIKPGTTSSELVSLLDFSSTFLDIAQAPPMEGVHGRSLVPIMKGETPADWRKSHYYHYYEFPVPHRVRPHYGVITDRYKLIHYYKPDVDDWELLDRQKDPLETRSFYNDPEYADTVKELKAEIVRLQKQFGETVPPPRFTHGNKAFDNEPQPPEQPKKKGKGKKKAE